MLLDKYLPDYHYSEKHNIIIKAPAEKIFELARHLDVSESRFIKLLFRLRGMPSKMLNREGLQRNNFIELERTYPDEIIIGLIGQFWRPDGNLQLFKPDAFVNFGKTGFLKSVWNFQLIAKSPSETLLTTETRVQCLGKDAHKKFSIYWFFVRPFSGLIRKAMLKSIKRKAEYSY
jgi:hypothetical protein